MRRNACFNRELKQTTTATATRSAQNKRFNEQNNSSVRAFGTFVHYLAVLCKITTRNDQVVSILENVNDGDLFFVFSFRIKRWHYI